MMCQSVKARFHSRRLCAPPKRPGCNGILSRMNRRCRNSRFRKACAISKHSNGNQSKSPIMKTNICILVFLSLLTNATLILAQPSQFGIFFGQADIGSVAKPVSASFDLAKGEYLIAGGGENMWSTNDAFHFVSKQMSGDFTLTADVRWIGTNGNEHRKACLVIRQTLDPGSAYADVALHGNGLTSLQFRDATGGLTHEIQANISAPGKLRLEKRGDYISMSLASAGGELNSAGGYLRVPFKEPFYV